MHGGKIDITAPKEILQASPLFWRFGMKRKMSDLNAQAIICFQFLNTPGTEVAPGSDVVGENFKGDVINHDNSSF